VAPTAPVILRQVDGDAYQPRAYAGFAPETGAVLVRPEKTLLRERRGGMASRNSDHSTRYMRDWWARTSSSKSLTVTSCSLAVPIIGLMSVLSIAD
jgi:hypothetical protein